jgi:hypothetical protein
LSHGKGIDTGLGAAVTIGSDPSSLNPYYGSGLPVSFQVYLRIRASRNGGQVDQGNETPTSRGPGTTVTTVMPFAMSVDPASPVAGAPATLTVALPQPLASAPQTVVADISMETMDMGTSHYALRETAPGVYACPVRFAMAGPWRINATVKPDGAGTVTQSVTVSVKP